nr:uncharacterized protein LOC109734807 isoform X2 [Aegilops tauschii subsp. strangulata]
MSFFHGTGYPDPSLQEATDPGEAATLNPVMRRPPADADKDLPPSPGPGFRAPPLWHGSGTSSDSSLTPTAHPHALPSPGCCSSAWWPWDVQARIGYLRKEGSTLPCCSSGRTTHGASSFLSSARLTTITRSRRCTMKKPPGKITSYTHFRRGR